MHLHLRHVLAIPRPGTIIGPKPTAGTMATHHTPTGNYRVLPSLHSRPFDPLTPVAQLNIFSTPLLVHSLQPPTGYARDGYCHAPASDAGNHSVAAVLTREFLEFSKSRGNDLMSIGLDGGCRWCLCVSRWKEALAAYRSGELSKEAVPRVVLGATGRRALEECSVQELVEWQVDE